MYDFFAATRANGRPEPCGTSATGRRRHARGPHGRRAEPKPRRHARRPASSHVHDVYRADPRVAEHHARQRPQGARQRTSEGGVRRSSRRSWSVTADYVHLYRPKPNPPPIHVRPSRRRIRRTTVARSSTRTVGDTDGDGDVEIVLLLVAQPVRLGRHRDRHGSTAVCSSQAIGYVHAAVAGRERLAIEPSGDTAQEPARRAEGTCAWCYSYEQGYCRSSAPARAASCSSRLPLLGTVQREQRPLRHPAGESEQREHRHVGRNVSHALSLRVGRCRLSIPKGTSPSLDRVTPRCFRVRAALEAPGSRKPDRLRIVERLDVDDLVLEAQH